VLCVPLTGLSSLQAPEAWHAVVLAEDQMRVVMPPAGTLLRIARMLTVGPKAASAVLEAAAALADVDSVPPIDGRRRKERSTARTPAENANCA